MQLARFQSRGIFVETEVQRYFTQLGRHQHAVSSHRTVSALATGAPTLDGVAPAISKTLDEDCPIVRIDNRSDPFATVIEIKFGKRLGELLDTIKSLQALGLNIRRAKVVDSSAGSKFYITDAATSEKVIKSAKLEEIRLSVLNNMIHYHPESAERLGWGGAEDLAVGGSTKPLGPKSSAGVRTTVSIKPSEEGVFTQLDISTKDRPGLLTDIVANLKNLNVNVVSAEVDTVGDEARDTFYITYHGEALSTSMETLVVNVLQYHLQLSEFDADESY